MKRGWILLPVALAATLRLLSTPGATAQMRPAEANASARNDVNPVSIDFGQFDHAALDAYWDGLITREVSLNSNGAVQDVVNRIDYWHYNPVNIDFTRFDQAQLDSYWDHLVAKEMGALPSERRPQAR